MKPKLSIHVLAITLALGGTGYHPDTGQSAAPSRPESRSAVIDGAKAGPGAMPAPRRPAAREPRPPVKGATRFHMEGVNFHPDDAIVLQIRSLRGALLRKNPAAPPVFDDKRSFIFSIDSGIVGIRTDSLTDLMNNYIFAYPKAPLGDIQVSTEEGRIKLTGKLHKLVTVPFEIVGELSATPEGKIKLHPTSIKALGVPVKGLLDLFDIELSELIKANEERGVKIVDDDLILDPELIIPPPEIRGKITAVRVEGDEVVQFFGPSDRLAQTNAWRLPRSRRQGSNYMYYRGGLLRFGKLIMTNADMRIVDSNPKDAFDFSIDHYNRQLVAGYSKNKANFGLVVHMPDYYRLRPKAPPASSPAGRQDSE